MTPPAVRPARRFPHKDEEEPMADTPKLDRPRAPGPLAQLPGLLLAALVPMDSLAGADGEARGGDSHTRESPRPAGAITGSHATARGEPGRR